MIQLTLTLKMTTAQVGEMSVTVNNSPIKDFSHTDDHTQPTQYSFVDTYQDTFRGAGSKTTKLTACERQYE